MTFDAAFKEFIKEAVREVMAEGQGPLMRIEAVAQMLGCKDTRTARRALANAGIPCERLGGAWMVNKTHLEAIGKMGSKWGRLAS